jgi:hypothetical protein
VLAVVEEQEQVTGRQVPAQSVHQCGERLGAFHRHAEGGGNLAGNESGVGERCQLDEKDAVGEVGASLGGQLDGETGLAYSAHAGQAHEPGGAEEVSQLLEFSPAADERAERHGKVVAVGGGARRGGRLPAGGCMRFIVGEGVPEDVPLEALEGGGGVEPQLFGQVTAPGLVGGERFGVAALPVEGLHERGAGPLPVGVLGQQGPQRDDGVSGPAETEQEFGPLLPGGHTQLLEADGFGLGEGSVGELGQRRTPPQGEGLIEDRQGVVAVRLPG